MTCGNGHTGRSWPGPRARGGGPSGATPGTWHEADAFVVPAIPDYVDGSFRTTEAAGCLPPGTPPEAGRDRPSARYLECQGHMAC